MIFDIKLQKKGQNFIDFNKLSRVLKTNKKST